MQKKVGKEKKMGSRVGSRGIPELFVIGLLLVAGCVESRKTHEHSSASPSYFMHVGDVKKGMRKELSLPKVSETKFLAREEADSIPFSSRHLAQIHRLFAGSPMAASIEQSISMCESRPVRGETRFCATSLEAMLDFVTGVLGESPPRLLASAFRWEQREVTQSYTIQETPEEIRARKMVTCHTLEYPYLVAYCHTQEEGTKAYKALMRGDNGDLVDMLIICHMDTSQWDPNNTPAFDALGTGPGTPICHVLPPHGNFIWLTPSSPINSE